MSCDIEDIVELSKEALSLQGLDQLEECSDKLNVIRQRIMNIDRGKLPSDVIWNLFGLLKTEIGKWHEDCTTGTSSLEVSTNALLCIRNAFVNSSQIQLMVAETDDLRSILLMCVNRVFPSKQSNDLTNIVHKNAIKSESEFKAEHFQFAKATITCLGNLVAANTDTRRIIWPHLLPILCLMLQHPEVTVSYMSSMVIFNCLLESEVKKELCSHTNVDDVICELLTLYLDGLSTSEDTLCFVLFSLEMILCCDDRVTYVWPKLTVTQQLLVLDILSNIQEGKSSSKCGSLSSSSVTFLINLYKNEADTILRTSTRNVTKDDNVQVIPRLLSFMCLLCSSEYWGPTFREDKSLLITTVSLLQCMNDIGNVVGNDFSRMGIDEVTSNKQQQDVESHPAYGFKRDLIRLIANLVYRHKANQDQTRDLGGVTLILESSQFDAKNPAIKEASIYAMRNLLEGNPDNQKIVKDLEYKGSADNQAMRLSREDGMVVVQGPTGPLNDDNEL